MDQRTLARAGYWQNRCWKNIPGLRISTKGMPSRLLGLVFQSAAILSRIDSLQVERHVSELSEQDQEI